MKADRKAAAERAQKMVRHPKMFNRDNLNLAIAHLECLDQIAALQKRTGILSNGWDDCLGKIAAQEINAKLLEDARDYILYKASRHDLNWRDGNDIVEKINTAIIQA